MTGSAVGKVLCLGFLIFIIILAAFARFYNLSGFGIIDNDTVLYSDLSKLWEEGIYINPFQKAGYHLLGSLSIKLLGYYDYNLLYMSAFFDLAVIFLIFITCRTAGINRMLSMSGAFVYAFLPSMIRECSIALSHITSSFFLLAAFYLLFKFQSTGKTFSKYLFLGGAASALMFSCFIHPSLLPFIPIFFLCVSLIVLISAYDKRTSFGGTFKQLSASLMIFAVCIFFVILCFSIFINEDTLPFRGVVDFALSSVKNTINQWVHYTGLVQCGYKSSGISDYAVHVGLSLSNLFSKIIIQLFLYGMAAAFAARLICAFVNPHKFKNILSLTSVALMLWGSSFCFLAVFYVILNCFETRHFIPLVPLIIIGSTALIQISIKDMKVYEKLFSIVFFILCVVFSTDNLLHNKGVVIKNPTMFRQMANALQDRVNAENNVLIAPYFVYRNVYWETKYIPAHYVYRLKTIWEPATELLRRYKIRYVVFNKVHWNRTLPDDSVLCSGPSQDVRVTDNISYKAIAALNKGLHAVGANIIFKSDELEIYEIPLDSFEPVESFETDKIPFYRVSDNFPEDWGVWRRVVNIKKRQ